MTSFHCYITSWHLTTGRTIQCFLTKAVFHPGSAPQTLDEYITLLLTSWCQTPSESEYEQTQCFSFPKEKQNLQAQRARPTNPNLRSTNWWPDNYFLPSWGTGQICRCSCSLLLVSPRGYTYNHYKSAPSEIILLDSGVLPLLVSLVSHSLFLCWHRTAGAAKWLLWLAFQDTFSAASCLWFIMAEEWG